MERNIETDRVLSFAQWGDRVRENREAEARRRAQEEEAQRQREVEQWRRILLNEFRL